MNRNFCSFYISCLLVLFSNYPLAEEENKLKLPTTVNCSLNVLQEQRSIFLTHCIELAKSNSKEAQYQLGVYYSEGKLTPPNYSEAIDWFQQASLQAHTEAQLRLGRMYHKGQGVPANNLQAYIILKIAAINGSDEAMDEADTVASQMSHEELQQATIILGKTLRDYMQQIDNTHKPQQSNALLSQ